MKQSVKTLTRILFLFYLLVLVWIVLFKMWFFIDGPDRIRFVNLVPFAQSRYPDGRLNSSELVNNVLIFVPFGVYLTMLQKNARILPRIAVVFGTSLLFEALQYAFLIGVSDVTDLLGNTAGGAIGVLCTALLYRVAKRPARVDTVLSVLLLVGSAGFLSLAVLLFAANG